MRANGFGINIAPGFQNVSAVEADGLIDLSVNVIDIFAAGFFMQGIYILGNDVYFRGIFPLKPGNGQMGGIGLRLLNLKF